MLNAIEQRIDAEFKGSPDQLLQLRVTVGDAYKNRGETAAARRVFQRAVDEATPHLPKDHLPLLRARVLASDFNLIVSVKTANDLAQTIDILRNKGADGAGILIDALLIQNMLGRRFHIPERMSRERMEASVQEMHALATRYFGAGSRERLKVVELMAFLMTFEAGYEEAAKLLRSEIDLADARPGVADSAEYLTAKSSYGGFLCNADQQSEGVRTVWDVLARVQSSHGASSLQLELPLTAMTSCMRSFADPSTVDFALQAFEAAAAREQPPSSNLMRRAEFALYHALDFRQLDRAGYLVQRAIENGPVFPEEKLRERFVRRVDRAMCLVGIQRRYRGGRDACQQGGIGGGYLLRVLVAYRPKPCPAAERALHRGDRDRAQARRSLSSSKEHRSALLHRRSASAARGSSA